MDFPFIKNVYTENDTSDIAILLKSVFKPGDIIILTGNLGAGKTFFVKEFLKSFNYLNTSSPSFSLVNIYNCDIQVYHFDFYRIKRIDELYDLGIEEYLNDENSIKFIEWASMFPDILPKKYYEIIINFVDNKREFIVKKYE